LQSGRGRERRLCRNIVSAMVTVTTSCQLIVWKPL
jgi:hypothetical protein